MLVALFALFILFIMYLLRNSDIEKTQILIATFLTILVFITSCFYGYRTAELSNMRNAEANVYTYIQLAENAESGSIKEHRNAAIMWLVHSNMANYYQQRNCAFTIFWLDVAICMAFAFLFALAEKPTGMWVLIIMALVFFVLFFPFAYESTFIWGEKWPETINIINPPHYLNLSYLDCSVTHTGGFEDYIKGYDWLESWLECKNPSRVWQDP